MQGPERLLRRDALGRLLDRAFAEQRAVEPPPSVLRAVVRQVGATRPAPAQAPAPAWQDAWIALSWPHGAYAAQLLTRAVMPVHYGLAS